MKNEAEKKAEEIYMNLQYIEHNVKNLQKQAQIIENQFAEISIAGSSLRELKDVKEGSEILVSVGPGIFANAELKDIKELIVNVGAGVAVKKSIEASKQVIDAQIDELGDLRKKISEEMEKMIDKASILQNELQKIIAESEKTHNTL